MNHLIYLAELRNSLRRNNFEEFYRIWHQIYLMEPNPEDITKIVDELTSLLDHNIQFIDPNKMVRISWMCNGSSKYFPMIFYREEAYRFFKRHVLEVTRKWYKNIEINFIINSLLTTVDIVHPHVPIEIQNSFIENFNQMRIKINGSSLLNPFETDDPTICKEAPVKWIYFHHADLGDLIVYTPYYNA